MKEEVRRIMNLVKEGKISPEDAAELIDAFMAGDTAETAGDSTPPPPPEDGTPPPPPPQEGGSKDPMKSFLDFIEGFGKEVSDRVEWQEVAKHVREAADRGMEGIKQGVEQIRQGKVNFGWFSSQEVKEVTLPLSLGSGKVLKVENPCGNIRVSGGAESSSVAAKAQVRAATPEEARAKAEAFTLIVEESDHQVLIRQPDVSGLTLDIVVQVAEPVQVEVRTHAGDIRVLDTGMGCRAASHSGDISLRGLNGAIEATSQNGDIHIDECSSPSVSLEAKHGDISLLKTSGNINARTASGDIRGRNCSGKTYSVESVSGDVSMEFTEAIGGTVNVRTVNGNAELLIPDACNCRVSLSTLKGEVHSDVALEDEAKQDRRITGRLGEGMGVLDVSAVNGDIALRWRDAVQS